MSLPLMPASEVVLRHEQQFANRCLLFAGDLQDNLAGQLISKQTYAHSQYYHHWQRLQQLLNDHVWFSLLLEKNQLSQVDTLLYFWPKNKLEAIFQLKQLAALLPLGCSIFIVGENRSGVRSAETVLADICPLQKIDSARRCSFYHGELSQQPHFSLNDYWQQYHYQQCLIKTLPSVFSHQHLDPGSQLLLASFSQSPSQANHILDMGCGAGVLATLLAKQRNSAVKLTLSDVNAAALAAAQATLTANQLTGDVIASDGFSALTGQFDLIISNPPFHDGRQKDIQMVDLFIRQAKQFLNRQGELRIVANAFLPYAQLLDDAFGQHQVLAKNGRFKVYQAKVR